ncbi:MAG: transglutaminase-like domain-containing protein [Candidatus Aminicenantes bacterium]|nr:transglutaminase-like domain-containing protein [Candidatus Aminicenantes bacterium]
MRMFQKIAAIFLMSAGLCLGVAAQASLEEQFQAANKELARCIEAKNWAGALDVLERQLGLADRSGDPAIRAGVLYNKTCCLALSGQKARALATAREAVKAGFTDYAKYAADSDLDALRPDSEFKVFLADVKARFGPRPLVWDESQAPPPFELTLDGPETPEFTEMRKEFSIDEVVAGAKDDYEKLRRLTEWVSTRWQHSSTQTASKIDPLTILREAKAGGRFICRDYAVVLAGVAKAYGMPARVLNLLPRDVETGNESHSVAEVWLEPFHKWVLADGQYGVIGELDGVPLSGLELQAAFAADKPVRCATGSAVCAEWKPFILRNAFYFKIADDQRSYRRSFKRQLVLVPKGSAEPHKFSGGNEGVFAGAVYTSNPGTFYLPPNPAPSKRPI